MSRRVPLSTSLAVAASTVALAVATTAPAAATTNLPWHPTYDDVPVAPPPQGTTIEFFDAVEIPADRDVDGAPFHGIAGLDRIGAGDEYVAVSNNPADPRLLRLTITADGSGLHVGEEIDGVRLLRPDGSPFAAGATRAGSVRVTPDGRGVVWVDNGPDMSGNVLREATLDGAFVRDLPVPEKYITLSVPAPGPHWGMLHDEGVLGFDFTDDGSEIVLTPQGHLQQDYFLWRGYYWVEQYRTLDSVDFDSGRSTALTNYDLPSGHYVTELLTLAPDLYLALTVPSGEEDLQGAPIREQDTALRLVSAGGFHEAVRDPSGEGITRTAPRALEIDPAVLDGTEGSLTWGPTLADGSRLLLVGSESDGARPTRITAFRVTGPLVEGEGAAQQAHVPLSANVPGWDQREGSLTMSMNSAGVVLGDLRRDGSKYTGTGRTPNIIVSDSRRAGGWTLVGSASDLRLTGSTSTLGSGHIGWTPQSDPSNNPGPQVRPLLEGGPGLTSPAVLMQVAPTDARSWLSLGFAEVTIEAPSGTPAGSYTGALTLSLFPED